MRALKEKILSIAEYELPVLITGESGTGKELVARSLHQLSKSARTSFSPGKLRGDTRDLDGSGIFW
jgi:sigma-54 specific flagellar transcriptional regulator A